MKKRKIIHSLLITFLFVSYSVASFASDYKDIWPNCSKPEDFTLISRSKTHLDFEWKGETPSYYKTRYQVLGFDSNGSEVFTQFVYNANRISISKMLRVASLSIRTICDGKGEDFEESSDWLNMQVPINKNPDDNLTICNVEDTGFSGSWGHFEYNDGRVIVTITSKYFDSANQNYVGYSFNAKNTLSLMPVSSTSQKINASADMLEDFSCFLYLYNPDDDCYYKIELFLKEVYSPVFQCGNHPDNPDISNTKLKNNITVGDIIFVNNFPILLTNVVRSGYNYSGKGNIHIPFRGKHIKCHFSSIKVNTDNVVVSGIVKASSSNPGDYGITNNENTVSQEMCLPPPEVVGFDDNGLWQPDNVPYNPFGFGTNGKYVKPPYVNGKDTDPNGFDSNGVNIVTGTIYNEFGCSQKGLDEYGMSCNPNGPYPYYWEKEASSEKVQKFVDSLMQTLDDKLLSKIDSIHTNFGDSLALSNNLFETVKNELVAKVTSTQVNKILFFGPSDKYITKGFSTDMIEPSLPPKNNRDVLYTDIEALHVSLYQIDKKIIDISEYIEQTSFLQQNRSELTNYIKYQFISMTDEEIDALTPDQIDDIIIQGIINFISSKAITLNESIKKAPKNHDADFDQQIDYYNSFASSSGYVSKGKENYYERIEFEYLQGFKIVAGQHRAFTADKLASFTTVDGDEADLLPFRISKLIAGVNYSIIIDQMTFTPSSSKLNAYFILDETHSGKKFVFEGIDLPFTPGGLKTTSENPCYLKLAEKVSFKISNALKGYILSENDKSYVSWDCNGLKEISADLSFEICRNYLIPLDESNDTLPSPEKVNIDFSFVSTNGWGDIYAEVDIDPFVIKNIEDIKWKVQKVKIDLSDYRSPPTFNDTTYTCASVNKGRPYPIWQGVYIEELSASLPNQFSKNDEDITVGVNRCIFDQNGFTGSVFAEPILSLNDGDLNGWGFSIDRLSLHVQQNNLIGGSLNGMINIPIVKNKKSDIIEPEDCFEYTGSIFKENKYLFSVKPKETLKVPLWFATMNLNKNSEIFIAKQNNEFIAKANLHGNLNIAGDVAENVNLSIGDISFQNVELSNKAPYFNPGVWSTPKNVGAKFAGFGVNIKVPTLKKIEEDKVALDLGLYLSLGDKITAGGGVDLYGKMVTDVNGKHIWKYENYQVREILVDASFPGVKELYGKINFFEGDAVYGKGFRGILSVKFDAIDAKFACLGLFGKTDYNITNGNDPYKYFMVDAMVNLGSGIPIGSGVNLMGFGGGISNRLTRSDTPVALSSTPGEVSTLPNSLGTSLSGVIYTPNPTSSLILRSSVALALANEKAFNANASFEIEFFDKPNGKLGGVKQIVIEGTARFMDVFNISEIPVVNDLGVVPDLGLELSMRANMKLKFNFFDKSIDGIADVYIKTPFMEGAMKEYDSYGNQINMNSGLMGRAELRIAKDEYYLNIGRPERDPDQRCKIRYKFPYLGEIATISTYMDIGTNIPKMAELPHYYSEYKHLFAFDENIRNSGLGFAFGIEFDFKQEVHQGLLNAYLTINLGADLMIQDYGNLMCNNEPIGINGWYAIGNMYGYVSGKLRLGKAELCDINSVVLLQGKFPNPASIKGTLNVNAESALGSFSLSHDIELGGDCTLSGNTNPMSGKEYISHSFPADQSTFVSQTVKPTVYFNYPLNTTFTIKDINGNDLKYVIKLDEINLFDSFGNHITHYEEWKDNNKQYVLNPYRPLKENHAYELVCKVKVYRNNTLEAEEQYVSTFTTNEGAEELFDANILYAYPVEDQKCFYTKQYYKEKGYIHLATIQEKILGGMGQNEVSLFLPFGINSIRPELSTIYAEFENKYGNIFRTRAKYSKNKIVYDMPSAKFKKGATYKLSIKINHNGFKNHTIYENYFRISEYNTFEEKLNALKSNISVKSNGNILSVDLNGGNELEGVSKSELKQFVQLSSNIAGHVSWYDANMKYLDQLSEFNNWSQIKRKSWNLILPNEFVQFTNNYGITTIGIYPYLNGFPSIQKPKEKIKIKDLKMHYYKEDYDYLIGQLYAEFMPVYIQKSKKCIAKKGNVPECAVDNFIDADLKELMNSSFSGINPSQFIIRYNLPGNVSAPFDHFININE